MSFLSRLTKMDFAAIKVYESLGTTKDILNFDIGVD